MFLGKTEDIFGLPDLVESIVKTYFSQRPDADALVTFKVAGAGYTLCHNG